MIKLNLDVLIIESRKVFLIGGLIVDGIIILSVRATEIQISKNCFQLLHVLENIQMNLMMMHGSEI